MTSAQADPLGATPVPGADPLGATPVPGADPLGATPVPGADPLGATPVPGAKDPRVVAPRSRAKPVKPGRMPVGEFTFDRAGAGSPFGDDIAFPVPPERLTYEHPAPAELD